MHKKFYHGEVIGAEVSALPEDAKKVSITDDFYVVGQSETHGNDHRIAVKEKEVEFYEKDGVLYMKNLAETKIYCPNANRHDTQTIPAGTWRISKAKIWDFVAQQRQDARD